MFRYNTRFGQTQDWLELNLNKGSTRAMDQTRYANR